MRDFLIGMLGLTVVGCGGLSMPERQEDSSEATGLGCAGECSGLACDGLPAVEWSDLGGGRLIMRGEGVLGARVTIAPADPGNPVEAWSCPETSSTREGNVWTLKLDEPLGPGASLEVVINELIGASVLVLRPSAAEPF